MRDWKYCPRCATPNYPSQSAHGWTFICSACGFAKYDNPLPTTVVLLETQGRVLLMRRSNEPRKGAWDAVGGFLSGLESAEDCARREAREELGIEIGDLSILGTFASVYGDTGLNTLGVAFVTRLSGSASRIQLSEENSEYEWFDYAALPDVAFDDVRAALARRREQVNGMQS